MNSEQLTGTSEPLSVFHRLPTLVKLLTISSYRTSSQKRRRLLECGGGSWLQEEGRGQVRREGMIGRGMGTVEERGYGREGDGGR